MRSRYALGTDEPPPPLKEACARERIVFKRRDGSTTEFMGRKGKDCPKAEPSAAQMAWRARFALLASQAAKDCRVPAVRGACMRDAFAANAAPQEQQEKKPVWRGWRVEGERAEPLPAPGEYFEHDIPIDVAQAAHHNTSHVPERRAEQERASYAATLRQDLEALSRFATTPEKKALLVEEFARYRAGFRQHYIARLHADGAAMCAQPTVENIAQYLFGALGFLSNSGYMKLVRIRLYENDRLWVDVEANPP